MAKRSLDVEDFDLFLEKVQKFLDNPANQKYNFQNELAKFWDTEPDTAFERALQRAYFQDLQKELPRIRKNDLRDAILEYYEAIDAFEPLEDADPEWIFLRQILQDPKLRKFQLQVYEQEWSSRRLQRKPLQKTSAEKVAQSLELLKYRKAIDFVIQNNYSDINFLMQTFRGQYTKLVLGPGNKSTTYSFPVVDFDVYRQIMGACGAPSQSSDEDLAIKIQTSAKKGESYKVNKFLRGFVSDSEDQFLDYEGTSQDMPWIINHLDNLLCSPGLTKLNHAIPVQRGISLGNGPLGNALKDPGQKSVSLDPQVALQFCKEQCTLLQIELPAGFPIQKVCQGESDWDEMEILLSRGTRFVQMPGTLKVQDALSKSSVQVVRVRAVFDCGR